MGVAKSAEKWEEKADFGLKKLWVLIDCIQSVRQLDMEG